MITMRLTWAVNLTTYPEKKKCSYFDLYAVLLFIWRFNVTHAWSCIALVVLIL